MPELVKIPSASAEYVVRFEQPQIRFLGTDRPRAIEAIVAALLPFKFRLANTELVSIGSLADHKVIFKIPGRGISFQFGAEGYKFVKDGSSWSTAEEDAKVLVAAESALLEGSGAKIESCMLTIAMHLQPLAKTREEILARMVPEPFKAFMTERQAQTFGNHLKWADGDVLLDFSAVFANGIFLRITSQFEGQPSVPDILAKVRSDEKVVFGILGLEEATNG